MKNIYLFFTFVLITSSLSGQLIFNEVLYDAPGIGLTGDANQDGVYSQVDDQFIELYNTTGANLDISGYTIYDAKNRALLVPNHTVPAGTILPPGGVLVVFGGGNPNPITGNFGGAIVQTSTFGDLDLTASGDLICVDNAAGIGIAFFDISQFTLDPNESYTRNPDVTGAFEKHGDNTSVIFSPGLKVDGTPFNTTYKTDSLIIQTIGQVTTINTPGGTLQMFASSLPGNQPTTAVTWSVINGTGTASISGSGLLTAISNGKVTVVATATDTTGVSASLDITISGQNAPIDDLFAQEDVILYPNPATDAIVIKASVAIEQIEIYSLQGKLVERITDMNGPIDVQHLVPGAYLIRVSAKDKWGNKLLVKK